MWWRGGHGRMMAPGYVVLERLDAARLRDVSGANGWVHEVRFRLEIRCGTYARIGNGNGG